MDLCYSSNCTCFSFRYRYHDLFIGPSRKTSHPNSALKNLTALKYLPAKSARYLFVLVFHVVITTFHRSIQEDISSKFRLEDSDGVERQVLLVCTYISFRYHDFSKVHPGRHIIQIPPWRLWRCWNICQQRAPGTCTYISFRYHGFSKVHSGRHLVQLPPWRKQWSYNWFYWVLLAVFVSGVLYCGIVQPQQKDPIINLSWGLGLKLKPLSKRELSFHS